VLGPERGREPTAEDYDKALAAVEELKNLVSQEPAAEKVLNTLGRISAYSAFGPALVLMVLRTGHEAEMEKFDWLFRFFGAQEIRVDPFDYREADAVGAYKKRFEDVAFQINQLKKQAKKTIEGWPDGSTDRPSSLSRVNNICFTKQNRGVGNLVQVFDKFPICDSILAASAPLLAVAPELSTAT
jgi:hypothetical protein